VPVLLHLNGPPGIGKSTLSALYADRHPGTLNLDIDNLHPLVGGWREQTDLTHHILRPVALAMASTHLAGGRDVVLPQFLGRLDAILAFEQVALAQDAQFREIVLLDERAESIDRFHRRLDDSPWGVHNRELVTQQGGQALLAEMYDRLLEVLPLRTSAVVIRSDVDAVESTYAALVQAVSDLADDQGR
jgi:hypothetical protein